MDNDTYTLDEARQELQRRECTSDGHSPSVHMATLADRVGSWFCGCGEVKWEPKR